jgi:hypothetical protein
MGVSVRVRRKMMWLSKGKAEDIQRHAGSHRAGMHNMKTIQESRTQLDCVMVGDTDERKHLEIEGQGWSVIHNHT